jgi:hypothetical protein
LIKQVEDLEDQLEEQRSTAGAHNQELITACNNLSELVLPNSHMTVLCWKRAMATPYDMKNHIFLVLTEPHC